MLPQEIIRKKRDGGELSTGEIAFLIRGLVSGAVTEGQAAAFAMAVFFNGMSVRERVALTQAMTGSGSTLEWDLDGPVLDKHSTGGVGDNVSLMLAPAVAACGGFVPMISGRGLGHTGGTLDKLESIPGYRAQPDVAAFRKVVADVGCAIIGQTEDLAPADKRLYAIRDVTATVESVPLITASILSKKLAAGLDGLVMDVKTGSGAFMPTFERSTELAESLALVATQAGLPTTALITDMSQPLASAAGNAVEVMNAIAYLAGDHRDERLHQVVVALGGEMLQLGGLAESVEDGWAQIDAAVGSGRAAEVFARMVAELGGPGDLLERPQAHLAEAPVRRPVHAPAAGFVREIDVRAVGLAVVALGGGRTRPQDQVDPAVGFTGLAELGAEVGPDAPIAMVHARTDAAADAAAAALRAAYLIGETAPEAEPTVLARFAATGDEPASTPH
ncbi:thymidine phosphorylase [Alsobacter sp. R-9]